MGRIDVESFKERFGVRFRVWLDKKYNEENLSLREIGDLLDCSQTTVSNYLDKYNLKCSQSKGKQVVRKVRSRVDPSKLVIPEEDKKSSVGYRLFEMLSKTKEGAGNG